MVGAGSPANFTVDFPRSIFGKPHNLFAVFLK
jgi:hypothetical protein